ncbi:MAG: NAD(P)/FAD-dependent oxidoreductase [Pirellulaceae bacterium]|nr:NAD(P)/FAD-dependent oxidoreductase [Pirellulaceae bacterium]
MPHDVLVLGAGAAGLLAATIAAERGRRVLLVEKNPRPGVKILMSGGTRCNLTQATDKAGIVRAYGSQGNFLHSALAALGPADLVKLIEDEGVPTKVEETGKIFPVSNRATDVLEALLARFRRGGAELALGEPVSRIERTAAPEAGFRVVTSHRELAAPSVIVTVGGMSYPGSGTTGDGYAWARDLGHTIAPPRPALVPLTTSEPWVRGLSGITIPDVAIRLWPSSTPAPTKIKPLDERRGSLLFTHFGLSGPVILDISRGVTALADPNQAELACDFLPDLAEPALDDELRQAAARDGKRHIAGILAERLPRRLIEALLQNLGLASDLRGAELAKAARHRIVRAIKATPIPITGTRGFAKAEVTAGGVALGEVDSRTMQSKLVPGLYFAGEVLDLDGPIGGYNFQAAFSTGMLAGKHA